MFTKYKIFAENLASATAVKIATSGDDVLSKNNFLGKKIKQQISFTPYIYNPCSARCLFCSEKITRLNQTSHPNHTLSSDYFEKLNKILNNLKDTSLFLSISGMEPLESLEHLDNVLDCFDTHAENGGKIAEKVIYSNLSALAWQPQKVIDLIQRHNINRIETSRHHYNEDKNQEIAKFRDGYDIKQNSHYVKAINLLNNYLNVKLACVLQKNGINSVTEAENYINWAGNAGITNITFREFSMLGEHFNKNAVTDYINNNRVDILSIIQSLSDNFKLLEITEGYYFISFKFLYKNKATVYFEASDYKEMIKQHNSDIIHKLIYYPNAHLCMDWNMQQRIY